MRKRRTRKASGGGAWRWLGFAALGLGILWLGAVVFRVLTQPTPEQIRRDGEGRFRAWEAEQRAVNPHLDGPCGVTSCTVCLSPSARASREFEASPERQRQLQEAREEVEREDENARRREAWRAHEAGG